MSESVQLTIANQEEWEVMNLAEVLTGPSRFLYPALKYDVSGLDPFKVYTASIAMERVDDFVYRFQADQWLPISVSETDRPHPQVIFHQDGEKMGADWMTDTIDFSWIHVYSKIPKKFAETTFILETKHLYQPRLELTDGIETFVLRDGIQKFIPLTYATPRLKNLKKKIAAMNVTQVSNRKRAATEALRNPPKIIRLDIAKVLRLRKEEEANKENLRLI